MGESRIEFWAMTDKASPRRYRHKATEITAWQFGRATDGVCRGDGELDCGEHHAHVHTIHGGQILLINLGDWIVPEPDGQHFYAIKPDIFEANYEAADD